MLEMLLEELDLLDHELLELEETLTNIEYSADFRLTRREKRGVLKLLESRRIEVLAEMALAVTAIRSL